MADKDATRVEQQPQLLVSHLQRYKWLLAPAWLQISRMNTRVVRQMVDNWFASNDVVVNKGIPLVQTLTTKDRNSAESKAAWSDNSVGSVRSRFNFFKLERNELGIESNEGSGLGCFSGLEGGVGTLDRRRWDRDPGT